MLRLDAHAAVPAPARGEVLIKVRMAGVCATDLEILRGYMNFRGILGHEFVGVVDRAANRGEGRSPGSMTPGGAGDPGVGERVVAEINCVCGRCDMCSGGLSNHCRRRTVIGIDGRPGAFAEYVAVPAANCHRVPDQISDAQAVFVEPLAAAFQITKQIKLEPRTHVMVLGSGRLGLLVAQVLARAGCRLAVLGRNPRTLGWLDRKGIQTMTAEDLRSAYDQDVVVDCTGSAEGLTLAMRLVRPRGTIVMKSTVAAGAAVNLAPLVVNEVNLIGSRCGPFTDAIQALARREIEVDSLISQTFPLTKGVAALQAASAPENTKVLIDASR